MGVGLPGGFQDIWMSEGAASGTVDIESLSRAVAQLHLATSNLAQALERPASSDGWVVVDDVPGSPPRIPKDPTPEPKDSAVASPAPKFRFRPPPSQASRPLSFQDCVHLCSSLGPSVREQRAARAWAAGRCAARVLAGEINYVDATPKLEIRSRLYVVLRHSSGKPPAVYRDFASFKRESSTVCHGFPTEGEARVFCVAAGCAFPSEQ